MSSRDPQDPEAARRGLPRAKAAADSPEVVALVHAELALVDIVARQVRREVGSTVTVDDLVSFGREGLLGAARSFDPTIGVPFRRWANYRIRGAMLDGVRSLSTLPRSVYEKVRALAAAQHAAEAAAEEGTARRPASVEEADARVGEFLAGIATAVALGIICTADPTGESVDQGPLTDEILAIEETKAAVREAMQSLPDPERHLVQRHYFDDVRLDEAAHEIGLSKSWGSRLHGRALESITRHLKRNRGLL